MNAVARLLCAFVMLWSGIACAAIDTYEFANEPNRERFRELTKGFRCPKCQNQNIADSDAQIAIDLRREVYVMVEEGKDDKAISDFMVSRYGDFVLYQPPVDSRTYPLWFGPFAVLLVGVAVLLVITRRRRKNVETGDQPLSQEEKQRLQQLLEDKKP